MSEIYVERARPFCLRDSVTKVRHVVIVAVDKEEIDMASRRFELCKEIMTAHFSKSYDG